MTPTEPPVSDHPDSSLLIRVIDDELGPDDEDALRSHLARCAECRSAYRSFALVSSHIQSAVTSAQAEPPAGERNAIVNWLEGRERRRRKASLPVGVGIGAGMAAAAALAIGIVFAHRPSPVVKTGVGSSLAQNVEVFQIANETFTALPYSNRDLPLSSPEIVQMRVPVASLAGTGLYQSSAVSMATGTDDSTVLADVLLGADGQPLGVHVLNND